MKPYATVGIRNRTSMESYGLLSSYCRPIAGSDCIIEKAMEVGQGIPVRTCYEVEDRKRLRKLLEREIREGKYTQAFFDAIDKNYKDAAADIKTFWKSDHSTVSNEELWGYFERFFEIYVTTLHPMVLAIYASDLEDVFESELRKMLPHASQEELIEYSALLLTPTRLTTVQKEEQQLFELEADFANRYPDQDQTAYAAFVAEPETASRFHALAAEYGWFHMEYLGESKTAEEYQTQLWERIEELKRADVSWKDQTSPEERLKEVIERQQAFFASHDAPEFFKCLVFSMQEFLIVLDFSKADLVEGIYYARPFLEELGKRIGLPSWIDVRYLLPEEIKAHLTNGTTADPASVVERKKNFCFILADRAIETHFGKESLPLIDRLLEQETVADDVREFKGQTAYPGKVEGEVCIVTSAAERGKFKNGMILVTRETTTELTSVIKQSIAIVADQGSLLSHTAIVSREFKIPCLVRTNIATKVLKDGDRIEVDASNGIVRLLT